MEALFYLIGISNYLNPEIETARHNLANDLKDKFHARRIDNGSSIKPLSIQSQQTKKQIVSRKVAQDKDIASALNSKTAPYELANLSRHENHEVRMAVCDNPNTPYSVQVDLSQDSHPDVRFRVAENYHVSPVVLNNLVEDDNPYISCRAEETLYRLEKERAKA